MPRVLAKGVGVVVTGRLQQPSLRSSLGMIPGAVITVGSEGGGRPAQVVYVDIGSAIVVQVRSAGNDIAA